MAVAVAASSSSRALLRSLPPPEPLPPPPRVPHGPLSMAREVLARGGWRNTVPSPGQRKRAIAGQRGAGPGTRTLSTAAPGSGGQ